MRRPPRMFSVRTLMLSFLLGIVTSLLVAGVVGWFEPFARSRHLFMAQLPARPEWLLVTRDESLGVSNFAALVKWSVLPSSFCPGRVLRSEFKSAHWEPTEPISLSVLGSTTNGDIFMTEWGWPFRCVWGTVEFRGMPSVASSSTARSLSCCIPVWWHSRGTPWIPFAPISAGLALDSAFWSVPWWAFLFAVHSLRRSMRRRRNHCTNCNYSFQGLSPGSPCPECGNSPTQLRT
jgi:hypothetical protein